MCTGELKKYIVRYKQKNEYGQPTRYYGFRNSISARTTVVEMRGLIECSVRRHVENHDIKFGEETVHYEMLQFLSCMHKETYKVRE
jgi:hypothetical protein